MKKKIWLLLIPILLILIFSIIYFVKNNNTNPYFFDKKGIILEKDPTKGLTYQDHFNNEWVWIVVPKKIFKTAKNKNDYSHIYNDILNYISDYHNDNYNDDKYLDLRNKTLESIYTYGGFWLSRYEIGNDNGKVVSQKNKYVYNKVTLNEALDLAKNISNQAYNTNLLLGFQWDLVCKFIEENSTNITKDMLINNSSSWGNYYSSEFILNEGQYSLDYGTNYQDIKENETKKAYQNYLLTTGASEQNKALNIYDFAGNVSEWTLEVNKDGTSVIRDGSFYFNYGGNDPVVGRYTIDENSKDSSYGFRISLIK